MEKSEEKLHHNRHIVIVSSQQRVQFFCMINYVLLKMRSHFKNYPQILKKKKEIHTTLYQ